MSPSLSPPVFLLVALLSLGAACREPASPPPTQSAPPRVSSDARGAPFDLGSLVRRVHFAYRPQGDGWTAGHSTWSARVTASGLTFTPRHTRQGLTGAPVTFGPVALSRGGVPLDSTVGLGAVSQDGSLSLARGLVEEQLQNGEDGIEQRWIFARAPQGEGALLLRVPVRGLEYVGETSQGVHFADTSGLGVRYSHAVWTDAAGRRTELHARAVAGAVEFQVPATLLASSSFPVMLAPTISPELGLDTPVTDPGGGAQVSPAVASNGTDYLVVWADDRDGDVDVYGARVSQAGAVLDSLGIPIAQALNSQQSPAVAFDGTNYLVVWSDGRRGSGTDIYGARVSTAGSVLDPSGLALSSSSVFSLLMSAPAIAFDGTNYLIIWDERLDFHGPADLLGLRVSPAGTTLGSPFTVSGATGNQLAAALAFNGTNYLAVWQDDRSGPGGDIYAARISPAGAVLDPAGLAVSIQGATQANPAVEFNGSAYLIVWEDHRNQLSTEIDLYGARVFPGGAVLDPSGLALIEAASTQTQPALARVGDQYLLAWQDLRAGELDVYAARVAGTGAVLEASGVSVAAAPGLQSTVAVAASGTNALLTWSDDRTADIIGARVDTSAGLTVLDPSGFTVSLSANSQTSPAVAFDGTNYLVVWQDNRGAGFDLYGVRISGSGTVLDPAGIPISGASGHQRNPAVAFDGTNYLVAWEDTRNSATSDIFAARVSPEGAVLDASGLPLCLRFAAQTHPAVAFDGTNYLVVWDDAGASAARDIYGTRVSRTGAVLDPLFLGISTDPNDQASPAIAFDGTNYLVVWNDWRNNSTADIYGARVSRAGAVLDTTGVQLAGGSEAQVDPALAFDGTTYLLVWSDYQSFPSSNLSARRVRTSGTPLDNSPITLSAAEGHQQQASVVYTGTEFLVAWQDDRGGTGTNLYGGRISRAGAAMDGDGFVLSESPADETHVVLSSGGEAGVLAVYQVADPPLGSNVQRLKARRLDSTGNTPPTAVSQSVTTNENVSLPLELVGLDAEGDTLVYTVVTAPAHGALTGTMPKPRYVPVRNYSGPDSFTFTASDGQATSAPATVSITILPDNGAPVATSRSLTLAEDTPIGITLSASDPDGDTLTFTVTPPAHGTLTGTAPNLTYRPARDYFGPDTFTFTASDGLATSTPATVSLTITAVNDTPTVYSQTLTVPAGSPTPIYLLGTDVEGDDLTFTITSPPEQGSLTGTPPDVVYTPPTGFTGATIFFFSVSDGNTSSSAKVELTVLKRSLTVSAAVDTLRPAEGQPVRFYANAVDERGEAISLQWVFGDGQTSQEEQPVHTFAAPGSYVVHLKATTATEDATTSLRLRVRSAALVTLTDSTAPAPPAEGVEGSELPFALHEPQSGLTYTWDFGDGSPTTTGATASHTWADDGRFTLKVTAEDGSGSHLVATRTVIIHNTPPVPLPQEKLSAQVGQPVSVQLSGSDAAGARDPLRWELVSGEGTLAPDGTFTWTPSREGLATVITQVLDGDGGAPRLAFQISTSNTAPEPDPSTGCGCGTSSGGASGALGLGLLMLALLARSRGAHG